MVGQHIAYHSLLLGMPEYKEKDVLEESIDSHCCDLDVVHPIKTHIEIGSQRNTVERLWDLKS